MVLSADLINLILYCVQQLGVTLSVGSETILLVAYISAIRDGFVDTKEAQFSRAVRGVLNWGLVLIITSGIGITVLHVLAGESATIFTPAYLFKWCLILLALVLTLVARFGSQAILEGVAGGTWYALFLVHILAPVTTWTNLLTLYAVWLVGFALAWWALVLLAYGKKQEPKKVEVVASTLPPKTFVPKPPLPTMSSPKPTPAPAAAPVPAPTPVTPAPPAFKPIVPPPPPPIPPVPKPAPVIPANLPVITAQPKVVAPNQNITDPDKNPGLPAIRVMAKTPKDLENQNRAEIVNFD